MKTTRRRETKANKTNIKKTKPKDEKMEPNQKCFKRHWQGQGNAKMPMFRWFGAFVVFIVSGLFEYCGTINREKRTTREEKITHNSKNKMTNKSNKKKRGHQQ